MARKCYITELELPEHVHRVLKREGFETLVEVLHHPVDAIRKRLKLSSHDIALMYQRINESILHHNYKQLLNVSSIRLSLGCSTLDHYLGGGLSNQGIIEVFGESGTGKTQLALQLCLMVQLPVHLGGLDAGAIYLSTEGRFPFKRLEQMHHSSSQIKQLPAFHEAIDNIVLIQSNDLDTQMHAIRYRLIQIIESRKIGIIILDSITALFRGGEEEESQAAKYADIYAIGACLKQISSEHNIIILCINQVTDSFVSWNASQFTKENGQYSYETRSFTAGKVIPALGYVWSNIVNTRIGLSKKYSPGGELYREMKLHFTPNGNTDSCLNIIINHSGISAIK